MAQHSTKVVEPWNASEEIKLREAKKQKADLEEMKKAKIESKESLEKRQASEVASNKWREEKTRELANQQRNRKKRERHEVKREEEMTKKSPICLSGLPGMVSVYIVDTLSSILVFTHV